MKGGGEGPRRRGRPVRGSPCGAGLKPVSSRKRDMGCRRGGSESESLDGFSEGGEGGEAIRFASIVPIGC